MIDNIPILLQRQKTKVVAPGADARFNLSLVDHLQIFGRAIAGFVVSMLSFLLTSGLVGCSLLSHTSGFDSEQYVFPGVAAASANGDGTFTLTWEAAPAITPLYLIYVKQGTDVDPNASGVSFNFSQPWKRVSENSVTTDNLTLSHNTCFAVKLEVTDYVDNNMAQVCTGHERFVFPGVSSLSVRASGKFALSWAAVPDTEVVYSVYTRDAASAQSYDFSADPLLRTSETLVETRAFPLNENRCFLVRFKSRLSATDANVTELCSSDDGVVDFQGVNTVTSTIAGQVTISWVKSVNPAVTGYRIYQGNDFQLKVGVAEASANRITLTGFAAGERMEFGVRAYDRLGREDDNVKTVLVQISDAEFATGSFPGCVSAVGLDTSRIKVTVLFPPGASSMRVYRNSVQVGVLNPGSIDIT